ncbi:MAG: hypothetical protein PHW62_00175 [Candidatus Ratteibacteria bacterium]|nr:hypothetical protein [Candidatus Ratteibacteria bacterium]
MELNRAAKEIIQNIKTKYLDSNGMVSKTYPVGTETIYADFDDILPFLLYFGENDFTRNQIELSRQITYNGMTTYNDKIISWRNDEYLGAVCCFYRQSRDELIENMIIEGFSGIVVYLIKNGHIRMCYDLSRNGAPDLQSAWSGGLIEVFLENSDLFPDWKGWGVRALDAFLDDYCFKKYGLFNFKSHISSELFNYLNCNINILPDSINQIANAQFYYLNKKGLKNKLLESLAYTLFQLPTGAMFQFMKANSNFIFALITAYRITKDEKYKGAIIRWIDSVLKKLYRDGLVYGLWYPDGNIKNPALTESFVMIDILCDTYFFVDSNPLYLKIASEIADRWLNLKWDNGLIPATPDNIKNHLDNQTDFSISLRRLAELTGNQLYLNAGKELFASALVNHRTEDGYVTSIYKDGTYENRVSPKYNGLLLKGLICWMNDGKKIYGDIDFYDLMKDR